MTFPGVYKYKHEQIGICNEARGAETKVLQSNLFASVAVQRRSYYKSVDILYNR